MAIVCGSMHWHHVDCLAASVNCTLIAVCILKLHLEYYYTYYFLIVLLLFQELPHIFLSWYYSINCSNHASSVHLIY